MKNLIKYRAWKPNICIVRL